MPSKDTLRRRAAHRAQDLAFQAILAAARTIPYERRVRAMGALTARVIGPLTGYRLRAEDNLARVYPRMPIAERRRIATAVCDSFGRTLIENYSATDLHARLAETRPTGAGLDALARARADGRPVLFVTGHFGNFEAPRHVLTAMGHEIGGLYRPLANPHTDAHYRTTMTAWGGPVFAQGARGTMGFARHLKQGGMGTLLFDVHVEEGVPIPFLGHPAMTSLSAAEMALRFDAEMIPYFARRKADGLGFDVEVEAPIARGTALQMMQEATARLEAQIARAPEQWFWVHRRWKP